MAEVSEALAEGKRAASDSEPAAEMAAGWTAEAQVPAAKGEGRSPNEPSVANQTIRVNVEQLENLMTLVSELVLTRNQLMQMVRGHDDSEFTVPLQRHSHIATELQEGVMKSRMQPIGDAWAKLPRFVCDLAIGSALIVECSGERFAIPEISALELVRASTHEEEKSTLLIFRAGGEELKAAPLGLVARFEYIDMKTAEHADGQVVVQYRDRLMPLVPFNPVHDWKAEGRQPIPVFTDRDVGFNDYVAKFDRDAPIGALSQTLTIAGQG